MQLVLNILQNLFGVKSTTGQQTFLPWCYSGICVPITWPTDSQTTTLAWKLPQRPKLKNNPPSSLISCNFNANPNFALSLATAVIW